MQTRHNGACFLPERWPALRLYSPWIATGAARPAVSSLIDSARLRLPELSPEEKSDINKKLPDPLTERIGEFSDLRMNQEV
jgi:hypothetical protein